MFMHPVNATYVRTRPLLSLPEKPVQVPVHVTHRLIVTVAIHCQGELRAITRPTSSTPKQSHRQDAPCTAFQSLTGTQKCIQQRVCNVWRKECIRISALCRTQVSCWVLCSHHHSIPVTLVCVFPYCPSLLFLYGRSRAVALRNLWTNPHIFCIT
jgi:hypothetical protein